MNPLKKYLSKIPFFRVLIHSKDKENIQNQNNEEIDLYRSKLERTAFELDQFYEKKLRCFKDLCTVEQDLEKNIKRTLELTKLRYRNLIQQESVVQKCTFDELEASIKEKLQGQVIDQAYNEIQNLKNTILEKTTQYLINFNFEQLNDKLSLHTKQIQELFQYFHNISEREDLSVEIRESGKRGKECILGKEGHEEDSENTSENKSICDFINEYALIIDNLELFVFKPLGIDFPIPNLTNNISLKILTEKLDKILESVPQNFTQELQYYQMPAVKQVNSSDRKNTKQIYSMFTCNLEGETQEDYDLLKGVQYIKVDEQLYLNKGSVFLVYNHSQKANSLGIEYNPFIKCKVTSDPEVSVVMTNCYCPPAVAEAFALDLTYGSHRKIAEKRMPKIIYSPNSQISRYPYYIQLKKEKITGGIRQILLKIAIKTFKEEDTFSKEKKTSKWELFPPVTSKEVLLDTTDYNLKKFMPKRKIETKENTLKRTDSFSLIIKAKKKQRLHFLRKKM